MSYRPHDALAAAARPRAELWRLVVGLIGIALIYAALTNAVFVPLMLALDAGGETTRTLLFLFSFSGLVLAVFIVLRGLHRRPALGVFGPWRQGVRDFAVSALSLAALMAVIGLLPPWTLDPPLEPGLAPARWLALLPLGLAAVLIQTGAEELVFRGYLQQQLAGRFRAPVIWMGVPALLFGLMHYSPESYGDSAGMVVLWAVGFGLAAADLTARTGTLGAAIGLHFMNNVSAILLVSMPGPLSGLALFRLGLDPATMAEGTLQLLVLIDGLACLCYWLTIRLALRR